MSTNYLNSLLAFLILLILSPILFISTISILLSDGYPFIFKQDRVGRNGKKFRIVKFRTLKKNTPNVPTNELNDNENYFFKTGRILRLTSIDELPNLINIIRGEMCFIGPRPPIPSQKKIILLRKKSGVLNLMPGITGYAQVNGRDNLNDEEKHIFDLYYLNNKSILLDLRIIILTFLKVIFKTNVKH